MKILLNLVSWSSKRSSQTKPTAIHTDLVPVVVTHIQPTTDNPAPVPIDVMNTQPTTVNTNPVSIIITTHIRPSELTHNEPMSVSIQTDKEERKRRRSKNWRPSLDVISENATLNPAKETVSRKGGEEKGKGKNVKVKGRVGIYTGCDDLRHFGPNMMPTFTPTAFLF